MKKTNFKIGDKIVTCDVGEYRGIVDGFESGMVRVKLGSGLAMRDESEIRLESPQEKVFPIDYEMYLKNHTTKVNDYQYIIGKSIYDYLLRELTRLEEYDKEIGGYKPDPSGILRNGE